MTKTTYLKTSLLVSALSLGLSMQAMAEERICRSSLGAITLDNVRVPQNAVCNLTGTRVKGTVYVGNNATLTARKVVVIGNVQGENARQVNVLDSSRIGGSVQVVQGGGANVNDSFVDADIQYTSNNRYLRVLRNNVGGNVQVFQNTGGAEIRRNVIDGNLQCKQNFPAPTGAANVVGGTKEDQCRRF